MSTENPSTPDRLAAIRFRDAEWRKLITEPGVTGHQAAEDRSVLLAEVDVLRAQVDLLGLHVQAPIREVIDKLVDQLREQAGGEPRG